MLVPAASTTRSLTAGHLTAVEAGNLVPVVSPALLGELRSMLQRRKFRRYLALPVAMAFVEKLRQLRHHFDDPAPPLRATTDSDDDYLVVLARSVQADALVSGDSDLT